MTIRYDIINNDHCESVWKKCVVNAFMKRNGRFVNPGMMDSAISALRTIHYLTIRDAMDTAEEYLDQIQEAEFVVD